MRIVSEADGEAEGHQPRRPPQPPPASLLQNTLVNYAFLNNRCVFWTTDLAGPVKCGAVGQTFNGTLRLDLGSCFAPKICSSLPLWLGFTEQRLIARRQTLARLSGGHQVGPLSNPWYPWPGVPPRALSYVCQKYLRVKIPKARGFGRRQQGRLRDQLT